MNKTIVSRQKYLTQIKNFINKDIIKVIIGQRRVGKSYMLLQIIAEIKHTLGVQDHEIIYLNKEDIIWDKVRDYHDLYNVVKDYKYIFIDEIGDIESWEKTIRSLQMSGKHDIYITGSNSNLLSSELSTFLSGRYISLQIFPLTYKEFLEFHTLKKTSESFGKYLKFGGLPYLAHLRLEEEIVYSYLKDVINTIILKDVIMRHNIRNVDFYKKLIMYLSSETGSIFSAKSMSDYLKSQKISLSPNIVLNYLENSIHASFLHKVSRYDVKGKRIFEIKEKYYFTDIGIKNALLGGYSKLHISGILENVVFSNLIANGWDVKVGEIQGKEVDFVCEKTGNIMYIQVAYLLESDRTRDREFASLLEIHDSWPKYVLSMDEEASGSINGVKWMSIDTFLLEVL